MKQHLLAAAAAVAGMASLQAQTSVINYSTGGTNVPGSTGYFSTSDGWAGGGAFWEGQQGWTGNGSEADAVEVQAGFTPGGADDNSGTLGFYTTLTNNPRLDRGFTPMSPLSYSNIAVLFTAEFAIAEVVAPNAFNDSFTFDLNSGGTSALQFVLQAPGSFGFDCNLTSIDSGGALAEFGMNYGGVYRLQIGMAGTNWSGTLFGVTDPSGARTITALGALTGGALANGLAASDFNSLEVAWNLASGDPLQPGSIALVANEFTIQSTGDAVPEPQTWALLLAGGAMALAVARLRSKARTAKAAA